MIEQIIIISLFCVGVYATGEEDKDGDDHMIFYPLKKRIKRWATYNTFETRITEGKDGSTIFINHPIAKTRLWFAPVWGCVLCMASLWGTIGFILLNYQWFELDSWDVILTRWIITIFAVCIMNGIIWNVYGLLGNLLEYWEEKTK